VVAVQTILVYDVPDDRLRTKIAAICLDYGLHRIQYSTFMGPMSRNRQEEVFQQITRRVGKREANVQLFALCEKDVGMRRQLIVTDEGKHRPMGHSSSVIAATSDAVALKDMEESHAS
jgi:CRISPR-associated protein Cas2